MKNKDCQENKKIVFIAMALSQPRCIKRVISFKERGFECQVYGYDRGKYDINSYPEDISVTNLGQLEDNKYLGKSIKVFKDIVRIKRTHHSKDTIFYAFGFFQALYLKLLGERYIYEISDILYAYPKFRHFVKPLKALDRRVIKSSLATVMTSGGFYSWFGVKAPKIFVIPNKVSPLLQRPSVDLNFVKTGKLSFGFVGSLRYESITQFAEVVGESFPEYEFHFWGGTTEKGLAKYKHLTDNYKNIHYHGSFRSPQDLPKIYSSFDITIACYQVTSFNEKIAEPNKLYESLFFCKPIVVSDGLYLSDRVRELDCGFCVNPDSKELIHDFISSLTIEKVKQLAINESNLDLKEIVNDQSALNDYVWENM